MIKNVGLDIVLQLSIESTINESGLLRIQSSAILVDITSKLRLMCYEVLCFV